MTEEKVVVIDRTESLAKSIFSDLVTFSFLIFCIWISKGSTWWTFLTGSMFILLSLSRAAVIFKVRRKAFSTKKQLVEWAETVEWSKE